MGAKYKVYNIHPCSPDIKMTVNRINRKKALDNKTELI